jgi:hypothetical protein
MACQLLDVMLAAFATFGQILGGLDTGAATTAQAVYRQVEEQLMTVMQQINVYPQDPNERLDILLNQSEDVGRQMQTEWRRAGLEPEQLSWAWHYCSPASHLTYRRVDGGIGP